MALAAEFDALIVGRFSAAAARSSRNLSNSELVSSSMPSMSFCVEQKENKLVQNSIGKSKECYENQKQFMFKSNNNKKLIRVCVRVCVIC